MNGEGGEQGEMESLSAREREVSLNFSIKQKLAKRKHQQFFNMFNQVKSSNVSFFAIISDTSSDQFIILDSSGASTCD